MKRAFYFFLVWKLLAATGSPHLGIWNLLSGLSIRLVGDTRRKEWYLEELCVAYDNKRLNWQHVANSSQTSGLSHFPEELICVEYISQIFPSLRKGTC